MMEEDAIYDNFVSFCFMYFDDLSLGVWMFVEVIFSGCIEHFISICHPSLLGSLVAQMVKNMPAMQETQVWSLGQEEGNVLPTPVCLPREFHGQRNLLGYSLWGCKELDMTEWLTHTHPSLSVFWFDVYFGLSIPIPILFWLPFAWIIIFCHFQPVCAFGSQVSLLVTGYN